MTPSIIIPLDQHHRGGGTKAGGGRQALLLQMSPTNDNDNNDSSSSLSKQTDDKDFFWQQQQQLMTDLQGRSDKSLQKEQLSDFQRIQSKLVQETIFCSFVIFPLLWLSCESPLVALSYLFGSVFGVMYTFGLGKYVETIGGTVDDAAQVQGAGVGQARFAFLILLVVLVGKFKTTYGLMELPSIGGFFTYQIASLTQGLREE